MNYGEKSLSPLGSMGNENGKHQHGQSNTLEHFENINSKPVEKQVSTNTLSYQSNRNSNGSHINNIKSNIGVSTSQPIKNITLTEGPSFANDHGLIDMPNENQIRKRRTPSVVEDITEGNNQSNYSNSSGHGEEESTDLVDYSHLLDDTSSEHSNSNNESSIVNQEDRPMEESAQNINTDLARIRTITTQYPRHTQAVYSEKVDRRALPFIKRFYRWLIIGGSLKGSSHGAKIRPRKNYETFPSKSVFFLFGGRFIFGDDTPLNLIVLGAILIVGGLYFGFV